MKPASTVFALLCIGAVQAPRSPSSIIILVDVTASMHVCPAGVAGPPSTASSISSGQPGRLPTSVTYAIPPAVEPFLLKNVPSTDRVRIGAIGRRLYLADRFAKDSRERGKQWESAFSHAPIDWLGPSPLWDSLIEVSKAFDLETGTHDVILVTDGLATGNVHSAREAGELLKAAGIRVAVVAEESILTMTPLTPMSAIGRDPLQPLRVIAETTGGYLVLDKAIGDFGQPCFRRDPATALATVFDWLHRSVAER